MPSLSQTFALPTVLLFKMLLIIPLLHFPLLLFLQNQILTLRDNTMCLRCLPEEGEEFIRRSDKLEIVNDQTLELNTGGQHVSDHSGGIKRSILFADIVSLPKHSLERRAEHVHELEVVRHCVGVDYKCLLLLDSHQGTGVVQCDVREDGIFFCSRVGKAHWLSKPVGQDAKRLPPVSEVDSVEIEPDSFQMHKGMWYTIRLDIVSSVLSVGAFPTVFAVAVGIVANIAGCRSVTVVVQGQAPVTLRSSMLLPPTSAMLYINRFRDMLEGLAA